MSIDPKILSIVPTVEVVDVVKEVFDYWVSVLRTSGVGPKPVLTDKRRRLIKNAVGDHGVATCLAAIDGCALSDWHMGQNPRGRRYDDIELILRDAPHVERFATLAAEAEGNHEDFSTTVKADW